MVTCKSFGVSLLGAEQADVARRFASRAASVLIGDRSRIERSGYLVTGALTELNA
jgi:hypothetical protein